MGPLLTLMKYLSLLSILYAKLGRGTVSAAVPKLCSQSAHGPRWESIGSELDATGLWNDGIIAHSAIGSAQFKSTVSSVLSWVQNLSENATASDRLIDPFFMIWLLVELACILDRQFSIKGYRRSQQVVVVGSLTSRPLR